jgi:uncharacterized membrane protein
MQEIRLRTPRPASDRLRFLDWSRGLAVVIMLQGHVFHSFSRNDLREKGPYLLSQLFGGQGPAIFLFLTGITLAFLIDRRERQGLGRAARWRAALERSAYLWVLAFLFRAQLWLFAYPGSSWHDLFKVDILNCMGFAIALLSLTALLTTAQRVRVGAILGTAIAGVAPLVSSVDWGFLPAGISDYFVPNYAAFAFFPWAAFIAFGISAGSILRMTPAQDMGRLMQWAALMGLALVGVGEYFSNLPYDFYPKSEFWLNGPGLVTIKLGVILLVVPFAWLWCEVGNPKWSFVSQLGTTSLIVYWVHIEIVYGRWLGLWHQTFTAWQCGLASVAVIALMVAVSVGRTRFPKLVRQRVLERMPQVAEPELVFAQTTLGD